jgi:hypothetical protein
MDVCRPAAWRRNRSDNELTLVSRSRWSAAPGASLDWSHWVLDDMRYGDTLACGVALWGKNHRTGVLQSARDVALVRPRRQIQRASRACATPALAPPCVQSNGSAREAGAAATAARGDDSSPAVTRQQKSRGRRERRRRSRGEERQGAEPRRRRVDPAMDPADPPSIGPPLACSSLRRPGKGRSRAASNRRPEGGCAGGWGGGRDLVLLPTGVGREGSRGRCGPEGGGPCCESPTAAGRAGPTIAGG